MNGINCGNVTRAAKKKGKTQNKQRKVVARPHSDGASPPPTPLQGSAASLICMCVQKDAITRMCVFLGGFLNETRDAVVDESELKQASAQQVFVS
jgi:hypothetical protein